MKQFVIMDGVIFTGDGFGIPTIYDGLIESDDFMVRFNAPRWEIREERTTPGLKIPIELLEEYYRMRTLQEQAKQKVVTKDKLIVIPSEEGISLRYGDIEMQLDHVDLEDFLDFCEVLVAEKEGIYAICND